MADAIDDFFAGHKGDRTRSAFRKFDGPGSTITGTITAIRVEQQRTYVPGGTGEPKFFANGQPMNQLMIAIATDCRDPEIEHDTGLRVVVVKGDSREMDDPARLLAAVRKAGATRPEPGGTLTYTRVRQERVTAAKIPYDRWEVEFEYAPPPPVDGAGDVLREAFGAEPVAAPDDGRPAAVDPGRWSTMTPEQRRKVSAALSVDPPF